MAVDLTSRALLFVLLVHSGLAGAQSGGALSDPTQPPPAYTGAAAGSTVNAAPAALSRLSSVKLPHRGGTPSAVIDGQPLRLGEMLGDAKLVRVSETAVVLEGPQGRETLYLIPDVSKTPAARRSAGQPSAKDKQ